MGRRLALKFFGNLFILPGLVIPFRLWPFIPLIYWNLSFAVNESSINSLEYLKGPSHFTAVCQRPEYGFCMESVSSSAVL